jgi:hypothetical protein
MKNENKVSQEKTRLDSAKIKISRDSNERGEKKGMVRKELSVEKNKETC